MGPWVMHVYYVNTFRTLGQTPIAIARYPMQSVFGKRRISKKVWRIYVYINHQDGKVVHGQRGHP